MALVTRASDANMDMTTGSKIPTITGVLAAEDLDIAAPCHINSSGTVEMSNATAANADAKVQGFTPRAVKSGQPVTLFGPGTRFRYAASGLTPGNTLYLGATDGRLDDGATTGDSTGVAVAVSATDIVVMANKL